VIHESADLAISLAKAEVLARRMPNTELFVVEGAAHAPNLTHPEPVNAAISAFPDRLPT
jgi:pimeloyl-ACP methyl ester carboxylesterase